MQYEVENKYRLTGPDAGADANTDAVADALEAALVSHGATIGPAFAQCDRYFNHPEKDYRQTDEALRIRQIGEENFVTYKGPKIDVATKTRRELELPLAGGLALREQYTELLVALGFRVVREVRKLRREWELTWRGQPLHGSLDEVAGLGKFLEIELLADEWTLAAAQQTIKDFADELRLPAPERRSYLHLLTLRDAAAEEASASG